MGKLNTYLFLDIDGVICTRRSLYRTMANFFGEGFNEEYWVDPELKDKRDEQRQTIVDSANAYRQRYKNGEEETPTPSWSMGNFPMDHLAIENLNEIVEETGCDVILSSSWRYTTGLKGTQRKLKENGFKYELSGQTRTDLMTSERGREIQHWLDDNTEGTDHYVIIDDDWQDIYGHHPENLVITKFNTGLTDNKRKLAIEIIKRGGIERR